MLGTLTSEQLEAYAIHHAILDLTRQIDSKKFDFELQHESEPKYDTNGRLINSPQDQNATEAQLERTTLVQKAIQIIPGYVPPTSFRPVHKTTEKVFLPVDNYPEINFVGLLIGPRGRTLQRMERESGARISIRGRGSSKTTTNEEENLHCIVSSENPTALEKAKELVAQVVGAAINNPEHENQHKKEQLRELATLNGTLRHETCNACGSEDHKRAECTQKVVCRACKSEGHFARDCNAKRAAEDMFEAMFEEVKRQKVDHSEDIGGNIEAKVLPPGLPEMPAASSGVSSVAPGMPPVPPGVPGIPAVPLQAHLVPPGIELPPPPAPTNLPAPPAPPAPTTLPAPPCPPGPPGPPAPALARPTPPAPAPPPPAVSLPPSSQH